MRGTKEGLLVRSVLLFIQPRKNEVISNVYEIEILEDNKGAKAMAENPLSSGQSKHIDVRWHFYVIWLNQETRRSCM